MGFLKPIFEVLSFLTQLFDVKRYKAKKELKKQKELADAIKGSDGAKLAKLKKLYDKEHS
tara:strand:+ start:545 stop:724 length:180 start_codon:yes stop_codon:yes gene_type:complete